MSTNFQLLKEMKKRVLASNACVDSLISVPPDSERFNNLLEVALQQQEMACIQRIPRRRFTTYPNRTTDCTPKPRETPLV